MSDGGRWIVENNRFCGAEVFTYETEMGSISFHSIMRFKAEIESISRLITDTSKERTSSLAERQHRPQEPNSYG
jgi:hypothetical protein